MKQDKVQIVIAWTTEDFRVVEQRRIDLGERNRVEVFAKPLACMWKTGGATDIEKAQAYAKPEGYTVFTYPTSVKDPLGQAKKDILKA